MTLPHGISSNVEAWLVANINGATAPFAYTQIAGGHSNLTFKVDDAAGHSYVLRRPPLGHRLASAHDMGREHRIIASLANSNVPVATARGLCTDAEINELPFYVMDFVDGHVVRDRTTSEELLGPAGCLRASESIVDTMAAIHAGDLKAVGLDDLGRSQSLAVASKLSALGPLPVMSSPLLRCQQTAFPLATAWKQDVVIEPLVGEIPSPAEYTLENRVDWLREAMAGTWSQVAERSGSHYIDFRNAIAQRVTEITTDTVVFSHFIAINAVIGVATDNDAMVIASLDNCSVTTFEVVDGKLALIESGNEADTLIR